jgi:hypothetical protein
MSADLQKRFRELSKDERVYVSRVPSHNDLCTLFTIRAAHLYLRSGGRLAFVMPLAALTRNQFERFRTGSFRSVHIGWEEVWTMDDSVQPLFPVPSCAVFGVKRARSRPIPDKVRAYSGLLPFRDASEELADAKLDVTEEAPALSVAQRTGGSSYRRTFRQGAILVPRMLCLVERRSSGRLGMDPSAPLVVSRRSKQEKSPWRESDPIENRVETEFLRPALLGESIAPYRIIQTFEAVVPVTAQGTVLDAEAAANRGFGDLHGWLAKAERTWNLHNKSSRKLADQLDYISQLSAQFPIAPLRVVYAKAGTLPAACVVRDDRGVIDHMLYWMPLTSEEEGLYLTAILNSEAIRSLSAQYQARGQWGARHFDKVMFNIPIPKFDPRNNLHQSLARAASDAETISTSVQLRAGMHFRRLRAQVRHTLNEDGIGVEIEKLVTDLLRDGK